VSARIWAAGAVAVVGLLILSGAATLERGGQPEGQPPSGPDGPAARAKVDINSAPAADLERLPGITQKLSQRIIANRPYRKIDDLVRRKVLGRKQLAGIKEHITVGSPGGDADGTPSR
jgi:competence protein ComEA